MARAKPQAKEPQNAPDPVPETSTAPAANTIVAALSPAERAATAWVEAHRWRRTATGTKIARGKALSWDLGGGEHTTRLEAWAELSDPELRELWGGGELSIACRSPNGIVRWVALDLEGPEPVQVLEDAAATARTVQASPEASASGVATIATALGSIPVLEGLDPLTRAVWVLTQQQILLLREQHARELAQARGDGEARVKDAQTYARGIVELAGQTANTAQTLSQSFFGAAQTLQAGSAEGEGKAEKSRDKLLYKLLKRERKDEKEARKGIDKLRDELADSLKKSGGNKDKILSIAVTVKEILKDLPEAYESVTKIIDAHNEGLAQAEADRRWKEEQRAEEEKRKRAQLEADTAAAAQRLDPTAQPAQPATKESAAHEQTQQPEQPQPTGGRSDGSAPGADGTAPAMPG